MHLTLTLGLYRPVNQHSIRSCEPKGQFIQPKHRVEQHIICFPLNGQHQPNNVQFQWKRKCISWLGKYLCTAFSVYCGYWSSATWFTILYLLYKVQHMANHNVVEEEIWTMNTQIGFILVLWNVEVFSPFNVYNILSVNGHSGESEQVSVDVLILFYTIMILFDKLESHGQSKTIFLVQKMWWPWGYGASATVCVHCVVAVLCLCVFQRCKFLAG